MNQIYIKKIKSIFLHNLIIYIYIFFKKKNKKIINKHLF